MYETERIYTASVAIAKWASQWYQSIRPLGSVVSVLDSDTIEVLHNGRAERIRLSGIDCPENGG